MDRSDIELCGKAKMTVAHAPIGNAKGGRIAPIMELRDAGARIALCTDTFSGDLIEAMRWAISMQRVTGRATCWTPHRARWGTPRRRRRDRHGRRDRPLEARPAAPTSILLDLRSPSMAPLVDGPASWCTVHPATTSIP